VAQHQHAGDCRRESFARAIERGARLGDEEMIFARQITVVRGLPGQRLSDVARDIEAHDAKDLGPRRQQCIPELGKTRSPFRRRRRGGCHLFERTQGGRLVGDRCFDQGIGLDGEVAGAASVIAAQSPVEILEADDAGEEKREQWQPPEEWSTRCSS